MQSCITSQSALFCHATESFPINPTQLFKKDPWKLSWKACKSTVAEDHIIASSCSKDCEKDEFQVQVSLSQISALSLLLEFTTRANQVQAK